ncbi:hypothetical protein [Xenorhabdus bovienii]|uniref:hypothetical protein n=1 Tax=Xenorhabdus bovienii TaxID=40576 RepID=UPI0001709FBD
MTIFSKCPVCDTPLDPLPKKGGAEEYSCTNHGSIKISDTVIDIYNRSDEKIRDEYRKKIASKIENGEGGNITSYDL